MYFHGPSKRGGGQKSFVAVSSDGVRFQASGEVLGWIDLSTLYPKSARSGDAVLNGIAYDAKAKRLFVTGKNWPQLYEIEVVKR